MTPAPSDTLEAGMLPIMVFCRLARKRLFCAVSIHTSVSA